MANNGRLFISHAPEDTARCAPLLTALDAWTGDYYFAPQPEPTSGEQLGERMLREIGARDILLRVCTAATPRSEQMRLEANAFRALQAQDQRQRKGERRFLINLILDRDYTREPFEAATLFIDATGRPRQEWLAELARAIGVTGRVGPRRVSRRALAGYGAASAVTLGAVAVAGELYATYHPVSAEAASTPHPPGATLWKLAHASPLQDIPAAVEVSGGALFSLAKDALTAYDLTRVSSAGPARLWSQPFNAQSTYCIPAAIGAVVYVGVDATISAFDAATGAKRWTAATHGVGDLLSRPTSSGAAIFALDDAGGLYAVRASDGANLWHTQVNVTTGALSSLSGQVSDNARVYVGSNDHHIYAFNASDGSPVWKLLTHGPVTSTGAVVNGVLYIGSQDNYLYALSAATGAVKWKYLTGDAVYSSPAVVDGVVYFASGDGYLYTLDAETGKPYWRAALGDVLGASGQVSTSGYVVTRPAVTGDSVTVIDDTQFIMRSFNRSDGAARWTYKAKNQIRNAAPIGAHGVVIFSGGDQTIYAFGA